MNFVDSIIFAIILFLISFFGIFQSRKRKVPTTNNSNNHDADDKKELLVGTQVSTISVALSLCSSFLSAVSIIGFPSEVYFRGTMLIWYELNYFIVFPIAAYVFLPTLYSLKLNSIYEYLERRFCFSCRILASLLFIIQMTFYLAVALYAPSLALSSLFPIIPVELSIIITASLSAFYLLMGGARAGIYTSALQMILILFSLFVITIVTLFHWNFIDLFNYANNGKRIQLLDFRLDPRIRHSSFAIVIGGSINMLSLFATNQLSIQRYIALPTLKKSQNAILMNIPFNAFILGTYIILGVSMYGVFHGCHPGKATKDELLPYFISQKLSWIPGIEGLFLASLYSAGISTLTGLYSALTAVFIEDILVKLIKKCRHSETLNQNLNIILIQFMPFGFAIIASILAFLIKNSKLMILQISLSIFGAAGGPTFGIFCLGMFCPWIKSNIAAFGGQLLAVIICIWVVAGALLSQVIPVNLPLETSCSKNQSELIFNNNSTFGTVISKNGDALFSIWETTSQVSYQYYSIIGFLSCVLIAHLIQAICWLLNKNPKRVINQNLLASFTPKKHEYE